MQRSKCRIGNDRRYIENLHFRYEADADKVNIVEIARQKNGAFLSNRDPYLR
jgi:hypothetical protein